MDSKSRVISKGYEIEKFSGKEIRLKIFRYINENQITVTLDKNITEYGADELKSLCAEELCKIIPEIFDNTETAMRHFWYLQYDFNDFLVSKPLGKGVRGYFGVNAKGEIFINEDDGCWTEYCTTTDWELKSKEEVTEELYTSIEKSGYPTSKEACEQLADWILEAKSENKIVANPTLRSINMDFEPDIISTMKVPKTFDTSDFEGETMATMSLFDNKSKEQ